MTELFIDGTSVALGKDFNIQVKRENPLFTKNGEYTYDITLPLGNATNAALYGHLNRLNSTQAVAAGRRAVLVADNRVYCNGTEIITGWTEDTVSIQIVSGNSELNYIAGGDRLVSSLEGMRRTPVPEDAAQRLAHVEDAYPDVEWCLPTVHDRANDTDINPWDPDTSAWPVVSSKPGEGRFLPQPYLCAYLKDMFAAMGFTMVQNQLEDGVYRHLILCNACGDKWNEMLPGWKVADFMEQLEKLFNATFVVDNKTRQVRFVLNISYYTGRATAHVANVVDAYEAETEDENEAVDYNRERLAYALGSNDFWKVNCLEDGYLEQAETEDIPASFNGYGPGEAGRADAFFRQYGGTLEGKIFFDAANGRYYLPGLDEEGNYKVNDVAYGIPGNMACLDSFAPLNRQAEEETGLELVPAETARRSVSFRMLPSDFPSGFFDPVADTITLDDFFAYCMAVAEGPDDAAGEEEPASELDKIKGWTDSSEQQGNVCLAFYAGLAEREAYIKSQRDGSLFHMSFQVPNLAIDTMDLNASVCTGNYFQESGVKASLRLSELKKLFYEGGYDIDYQHAIKLSSHDPNVYPANQIFEIRNRRYVCRHMEFTLDANGRKGAWTGTFYPIKISDTEADARWILTDGRWRDGGVWLDNGRWLDDPT